MANGSRLQRGVLPLWFSLEVPVSRRAYVVSGLSLEGSGVGAIRHCEFSIGPFVEPITRWEPGKRLSFDVVRQPPPMQEWSPFKHVHPPHLDVSLRSRRGEFRLVPLEDDRVLSHIRRRSEDGR